GAWLARYSRYDDPAPPWANHFQRRLWVDANRSGRRRSAAHARRTASDRRSGRKAGAIAAQAGGLQPLYTSFGDRRDRGGPGRSLGRDRASGGRTRAFRLRYRHGTFEAPLALA